MRCRAAAAAHGLLEADRRSRDSTVVVLLFRTIVALDAWHSSLTITRWTDGYSDVTD